MKKYNKYYIVKLVKNKWYLKFKTVPFTLESQNIKYLGINLIKYIQEIYEENCLSMMK